HTRSKRDWSSDVCSSDLHRGRRAGGAGCGPATTNTWSAWSAGASISFRIVETAPLAQLQLQQFISGFLVKRDVAALEEDLQCFQIGRAACREKGEELLGS